MEKLGIEQAEPIRKKFAPDWEIRKGRYLYKKVAFDDYSQVLRFLMAVEKPQVKLDHFADFMNFYNELTIAITTHDVNGLTQLDFELVLYIDEALRKMDARQIDENNKKKNESIDDVFLGAEDPVLAIYDRNGKYQEKLKLSVAAKKYKFDPEFIKDQFAAQDTVKLNNIILRTPIAGQSTGR